MIEIDEKSFFFEIQGVAIMRNPRIFDPDRDYIYSQLYAQMMGWA